MAEEVGGEAEAVADEILNKVGDLVGKLRAEDSGVLVEVVQNGACSEN